jgi:transposase-like protein
MECVACGSAIVAERPERIARGHRRFRCRECGKRFNERSGGLLGTAKLLEHGPRWTAQHDALQLYAAMCAHVSSRQTRKASARARR